MPAGPITGRGCPHAVPKRATRSGGCQGQRGGLFGPLPPSAPRSFWPPRSSLGNCLRRNGSRTYPVRGVVPNCSAEQANKSEGEGVLHDRGLAMAPWGETGRREDRRPPSKAMSVACHCSCASDSPPQPTLASPPLVVFPFSSNKTAHTHVPGMEAARKTQESSQRPTLGIVRAFCHRKNRLRASPGKAATPEDAMRTCLLG